MLVENGNKCGVVALVGRPSSGKSTLLNSLIKEKVAITSAVPQTTRVKIRGIWQDLKHQIIFLDTPGFHLSEKKFNKKLTDQITSSIEDADLVIYLVDITRKRGREEEELRKILTRYAQKPIVIAVNKIDQLSTALEKSIKKLDLTILKPLSIIPISALKSINLWSLLEIIKKEMPVGHFLYPTDYYTDQPIHLRVTEIVREKIFQFTREEVPHSTYCDLIDIEKNKNDLLLQVEILCERDSQKGIIVGRNGTMLKQIREVAVKDLTEIFDRSVKLKLQVKVAKKWRNKDKILSKILNP